MDILGGGMHYSAYHNLITKRAIISYLLVLMVLPPSLTTPIFLLCLEMPLPDITEN